MTLEEMFFKPHPILRNEIMRAKYKGHSIIHGKWIRGYEVMFPDGSVQAGFSEEGINNLLKRIDEEKRYGSTNHR